MDPNPYKISGHLNQIIRPFEEHCKRTVTTSIQTMSNKDMKVEIPPVSEVISPSSAGKLARQGSISRNNCLCSPTTHAGSFRCRLHRSPTLTLNRTRSIDSTAFQDTRSKANPSTDTSRQNNAVEAQ
ncbi:unnamed protein product [Fraxinus pennsylvanica]|uniref:Uncharacterized protein n=1 Tax=Fraxinus pennsylvanica TaxID=56036 RepID=A0AAD2ACC0_9LAMI|nr:unnamed protein product [Fraxinus pennsylvanica]